MTATVLIVIGAGLIASGVGALRLAWGRARAGPATPIGWAAIALGLVLLASREGAWGLAVGGLIGSAAAFALLAYAWWRDLPARAAARTGRTTLRLHEGGRLHLGRRFLTFLLVVFAAMGASVAAGVAAQAFGRAVGWTEADSNTLGLFVFPVAWTLLATVMMLRTSSVAMAKPIVGTLAASGVLMLMAI